MEEQPTTLATRVARGPGTDAEGVAAATFRLRRELPGLGAGAARLPPAGEPRREPGLWSWRHLARRWSASPVAAYPLGGRGAAGPASAGTSHRAAPHARRPPSANCGPTAAG